MHLESGHLNWAFILFVIVRIYLPVMNITFISKVQLFPPHSMFDLKDFYTNTITPHGQHTYKSY